MDIRPFLIIVLGCHITFAGQCDKLNNAVCQNGGTCVNIDLNDYECICLNGYSGKNCSWNEDDCLDNMCAAGSTCIDGLAKYTCACPAGKIGLFCHLDDPCEQKPCRSGAECVVDTASGQHWCNCLRGTTGPDCTIDLNECEQSDKLCFNGGICVNTFGSWYCDCPPGYSDPYCMTQDSKCEPNPCLNGASCLDYGSRYECICQNGYYGVNCEKICPAGFEGRACKQHRISLDNNHLEEMFEEHICILHNCSSKAGNNVCNSECNYPACQHDGLDCSAHIQPFRNCPNRDFCARVFQDNKCDPVCNHPECLFDGFDCSSKANVCLYEDYCSTRFNDGYCDPECIPEECHSDGTDCTQHTEYVKLEGSLVLIILMPPDEFWKRAPLLQFVLSEGMRARITIALDEQNRKRFYAWKEAESSSLHGTKAYFNVEMEQCQKEADCGQRITDVEQAANFVGVMSSNQILRRSGVPIYAAEAELPSRDKRLRKWIFSVISIAVSATLVSALLFALYKNFKRTQRRLQKKVHVTGTWFPPTLHNYFNPFNGNYRGNGSVQENFTLNKQIAEVDKQDQNQQNGHFTEICAIPNPDDNNMRCWTILHNQAMDSRPIEVPIDQWLVDFKTSFGRTALMLTALNQEKSESISCMDVDNLFQAGAAINEQDDCGETALMMAIKAGRPEVVKCLLQFAADPTITDDHKRTALHHAASINAADIIRLLLATHEIEVDAIDDVDCSPLMTIAKLGYRDPEASALLIDAGADINCTGDHANGELYEGRTALHYAIIQSNQELARYLVEQGADRNIRDHMGQTPLFLAASQGHVEMVHMLISAGARLYVPDNMDRTPEDIARQKEYREVVDYLSAVRLQNDKEPSGKKKKTRSRNGRKNVKKPRIIEISVEQSPQEETAQQTSNSASTSDNSNTNSSSSSGFSDHQKELHSSFQTCTSYENHYETTSQMGYSSTTVPQQNSQYFVQMQSYPGQMTGRYYTVQNGTYLNNGNESVMNFAGVEHYV